MTIAAQLFVGGRGHERITVAVDGTLRDGAWRPIDVEIADLSASGFRARTPVALTPGESISLGVAGLGVCGAYVVRVEPGAVACRFVRDLPPDYLDRIQAREDLTVLATPLLAGPAVAAPMSTATMAVPDARYRLPVRIAIIAGLALAGWGAIGGALLTIL